MDWMEWPSKGNGNLENSVGKAYVQQGTSPRSDIWRWWWLYSDQYIKNSHIIVPNIKPSSLFFFNFSNLYLKNNSRSFDTGILLVGEWMGRRRASLPAMQVSSRPPHTAHPSGDVSSSQVNYSRRRRTAHFKKQWKKQTSVKTSQCSRATKIGLLQTRQCAIATSCFHSILIFESSKNMC